MSKRAGGSTRVRATKIKKRKGVGSRTIVVLDSDEDVSLPTAASDYARVMKTRVGASGEAKGFTMGTIPILDVDKVDISTPLPEAAAVVRTFCVKNLIRLAKHDIKMVGIPSHQVLTQNLWLAPGG